MIKSKESTEGALCVVEYSDFHYCDFSLVCTSAQGYLRATGHTGREAGQPIFCSGCVITDDASMYCWMYGLKKKGDADDAARM